MMRSGIEIKTAPLLISGILLLGLCGCFEYSSLHTASMLCKKELQVVPECGISRFRNPEYKSTTIQTGFMAGYGLSKRVNLFIRYNYDYLRDYSLGIHYSSIETKVQLVKNRLAFIFPVALYFGKNVQSTNGAHIQPSLIITRSAGESLKFSLIPKWILYIDGFHQLAGLNANVRIGLLHNRVALIPEIGYFRRITAPDNFYHFTVGFDYHLPGETR